MDIHFWRFTIGPGHSQILPDGLRAEYAAQAGMGVADGRAGLAGCGHDR
jgi:hypothetical protein